MTLEKKTEKRREERKKHTKLMRGFLQNGMLRDCNLISGLKVKEQGSISVKAKFESNVVTRPKVRAFCMPMVTCL
ncbi:hypothetical protein JHK82_034683 [Glycine max]|uniref:Uncharacterized protein n=2 Tax=Glycine subgen. Soja TaxID=1462606 RepID=K7LWD3_SOYBN|nr:hypothetical protein JHK87_034627 [Glycine soja]KAG4981442.1 hypothetical protein JHK85_035400 [Glycine max]KAG4987063.1 hypothetical protein JHK86_034754 [Glycine max]KAG5120263.1 hypothetical protein JHK82_034683 [Glycine max]KAG5141249.1 hypothetical protein JHK84_035017 [Glycine max]